MRIAHLTTWRMHIRVLTPVHIGSGQRLTKREYIVLPEEKKVLVPSLEKLHRFLDDRGMLASFEQYLLRPGQPDLGRYLHEQRIDRSEWPAFVDYALDAGAVPETGRRFEINLFIKEASGTPFLPGSSVKGALRTALLAQQMNADAGQTAADGNVSGKSLESRYLRTLSINQRMRNDAVNDVLRGLRVSDSPPLPASSLTLACKVDRSIQGYENSLNLYRECLAPGVQTTVFLTFDSSYLPKKGFGAEDIRRALVFFAGQNERHFTSRFPAERVDFPAAATPLYLGGGAGYVTKTVSYAFWKDKQPRETGKMLHRSFRAHRHDSDEQHGVSPHMLKLAFSAGRLQPMGLCNVMLEPVKGKADAASV